MKAISAFPCNNLLLWLAQRITALPSPPSPISNRVLGPPCAQVICSLQAAEAMPTSRIRSALHAGPSPWERRTPQLPQTHRLLLPFTPGTLHPQGHSMQEQNHDPRVLHRPWCPEHSQSERCCLRCLFCQCTAVMHELEDVAGPCTGCGAGRARRQLFDNAPWAEEDKDSCKFRKAWINSSPFPAAREPSSRAFPQPTHGHGLTSSLRKNSPPWLGDSHTAKATSSDTT